MKIDVVIPAYNEEENIGELFERLITVFKKYNLEARFLFIIQGNYSAVEVIKRVAEREKINKAGTFYFPKALGVGRAFKIGLENISKECDYVLTMDADLNHQPEELDRFLEAREDADIIVGSRYIRGGRIVGLPLWKLFLSKLVNDFLSFLMKIKINDKTSGYRLMKREAVEKIAWQLEALNFDFYVEFIVRASLEGFRIKEVPITYVKRKYGYSKMKKISTFLNYMKLFRRLEKISIQHSLRNTG